MRRAKIVHVKVETGASGLLYATSADLPGLLVAGRSADALFESVPQTIKALLDADGASHGEVVQTIL